MIKLPKSILKFVVWLIYLVPKRLFTISKRLTYFINYELSFTLNVRLLFTPLYGDYTIIGRVIGFILRIIFILVGFIFVFTLTIVTAVLPLAWFAMPFAAAYFLDYWSLVILSGLYVYVTYLTINTPDLRVSDIKNERYKGAFRPKTRHHLDKIVRGSVYSLRKFLETPEIKHVLRKTELLDKGFEDKISKTKNIKHKSVVNLSYDYAKKQNTRYVEQEHLLLGALGSIPNINTVLSSFGVDLETIEKSVKWIVEQREYYSSLYFWQDDYKMPPMGGFGHGLVGRVTPDLDLVSLDYTKQVKKGRIKDIVGREKEIDRIAQFLGGSNKNILLIGEPGCGKTTIIMGLAHRIMRGTKYKSIQNKRIVSLEMGGLIAGTKTSGEIADKLKRAINDVIGSRDIILFIDEIHSLVGSVHEGEGFSTVFSILEPHLSSGQIQFIGATNIENYRKFLEPVGSFSRLFETVEIGESAPEDTLEILKCEATKLERKFNTSITTTALLTIIKLSGKLIHDRVMPDKALDVLNRTVSQKRDNNHYVTSKDVEKEVSEMTHIPITQLTDDESEKLINIADEMKKRVIGQDHSIDKIAAALRRARVGIRDEEKPIASFLFVGTTGVGKTETAKTLSGSYFGDRKAMIRLDMSEYQTGDSIDKLIGTSDGKSKGILTEAVRTRPFTVLLLDEIEKAHHQILTAFLQVLDDGRLTNSTGRTVSFTNTIIIATSNVGTKEIQEITDGGGNYEQIEESAIKSIREKFAPELLNRFTAIVVYKPLSFDSVKKIALILLDGVVKRAADKNIKISFTPKLIEELVFMGFNPQWGARPLARVIEESVETYVADKLLAKEFKQGDVIELGTEVFEK